MDRFFRSVTCPFNLMAMSCSEAGAGVVRRVTASYWQRRHVCFGHLMEIRLWRFFGSNAKVLKLVLEVAGHSTPYWLQEFSGFLLKLVLLQWFQLSQSWWRLEPCSLSRCLCLRRPSLSFSFARAALTDFEHRPPCATHAASRIQPELVLPDPVRALALSACDI